MDRREALKKLGVGTAVAVGTPLVLDTFNVASAASCGGLTNYAPAPRLTTQPVLPLSVDATVTINTPPAGSTFVWGTPSSGTKQAGETSTTVRVRGLATALLGFTISYTLTLSGRRIVFTISTTLVGLGASSSPTSATTSNCTIV